MEINFYIIVNNYYKFYKSFCYFVVRPTSSPLGRDQSQTVWIHQNPTSKSTAAFIAADIARCDYICPTYFLYIHSAVPLLLFCPDTFPKTPSLKIEFF